MSHVWSRDLIPLALTMALASTSLGGCAVAPPPRSPQALSSLSDGERFSVLFVTLDDGRSFRLSPAEVREEWLLGNSEDGARLALPVSRIEHFWTVGGGPSVGQSILGALAITSSITILAIVGQFLGD